MELPKINLPPIQTKYKIAAAVGIIALLLTSYYDNAYKPHAEKIEELEKSLVQLDDTINVIKNVEYPNLKDNDRILRKIETKKKKVIRGLNEREKKLPLQADYSGILEDLTRLAYKSGFEIKSLEPTDFTQRNGYNSMSLSLDIISQYANLLEFLEELKPYPIFLENITISVIERPLLKINLNLYILFN